MSQRANVGYDGTTQDWHWAVLFPRKGFAPSARGLGANGKTDCGIEVSAYSVLSTCHYCSGINVTRLVRSHTLTPTIDTVNTP